MITGSPSLLSITDAVDVLRSAGLIVHPTAKGLWYVGIAPLNPTSCRLLVETTLCWMATIFDQLHLAAPAAHPPETKRTVGRREARDDPRKRP